MYNPLVYKRRFLDYSEPLEPILLPESENDIVPDQSPNNPKFYDSHGYLQSDIALLFEAVAHQNNELAASLRGRFTDSGNTSRLDPSMGEDRMFGSTPSRFAQSPTEVQQEAVYISDVIDFDNSSSPSPVDGDKIEFSSGVAPTSVS